MSTAALEVKLPRYEHAGRVTQVRVLLSEWTKLVSLRSTRWSLAAATVLGIGLPCVFAAVTFLLTLPAVLISFFASQAILRNHHILQISFSHPGVARSVIGGAGYLVLIGLFALAIGAIVRNTAGGIAAFAALFFVIPPLMNILPASWNDTISPYLPDAAGRSIFSLNPGAHSLSPWLGFTLFVGYTAAAIAIAAVLLVRRDT